MSKIMYYSLFPISIIFIVAGVLLYVKTLNYIDGAIELQGHVVAIKTMRSESTTTGRSGMVERPIVEYKLPDGKVENFIPTVGSHKSSFREGQTVEVLYNPRGSNKVVLKSFSTTRLFPIILWGMGLLIIGVTILLKKIMPKKYEKLA